MDGLKNKFAVQMFVTHKVSNPIIEKLTKFFMAHLRENILKYAYQGDEARPTGRKNPSGVGHTKYRGGVAWYLEGTRTPSYEFLEAFKWKPLEITMQSVIAKMIYDWQSMEYDGSDGVYKHGNMSSWGDVRDMLDVYLNQNGVTSSHWLARAVRPYWKITIERMIDRRGLEIYTRKELSKIGSSLGVKIKKI